MSENEEKNTNSNPLCQTCHGAKLVPSGGYAALNILPQKDPLSPENGDVWMSLDGSIKWRCNDTTFTFSPTD